MLTPDFEYDHILVQRAGCSDRDALREIVERHQDHIYRLVYRLVGDVDVAQDITQDTFLKAFGNLKAVLNGRALSQWLRQIATNLVRDRWKTQKNTLEFKEDHPELPYAQSNPEHQTELREMEAHMQAALLELPPDYREVFVLKHIEEMEYEDICQLLNITVSAAKVRVHRACKMLREKLSKYDYC